jgi:hypothetical protein
VAPRKKGAVVIWRVDVRDVRQLDGRVSRWTLDARTPYLATVVYADVVGRAVLWLQSDEYSGDPELDALVIDCVQREIARRRFVRQLDSIGVGAR